MMKKNVCKWLLLLLSLTFSFTACNDEYDDSALRDEIAGIHGDIDAIKSDLNTLKEQVASMQTVVDALNKGKVVSQVEELPEGNGYQITFNDATSIKVLKYTEQQTVAASVIGVQQEGDVYYWTVVTRGKADFLLDSEGNKVPVMGAKAVLSLDQYGYWTLDGQRVTDANEDFIRFKKGDSNALFKDIVVLDDKIKFILADNSEIVVNKKTETYLRFKDDFTTLNPKRPNKLTLEFSADIRNLEVVKQPEGWSVQIHVPEKNVVVSLPANCAMGVSEIRVQGIDANGLVYMAAIRVGVQGKGFADPMGVFILNEGNMTTENGSLIYIDAQGTISDNIYEAINGKQLGNVTQDLFIHDKKMYIISQNGHKNAVGTGFENEGRLVVANSETLQKVAVYDEELTQLNWPTHIAVLDEANIFIRDNAGIYRFNADTKELKLLNNTARANKMTMAVAHGKVFAAQGQNLLMIQRNADGVMKSINMGANISGVVRANDGNLYVATVGTPNKISKVNSDSGAIMETQTISEGSLSAGWGATPGITAIGTKIYYSGATTRIYCHDFATKQSKLMVDAAQCVQNTGIVYNNIAVHPKTGKVYLNTIKGYGFDYLTNNISVFRPESDKLVLDKNYENHTRFPAGIFFPANFQ